MNRMSILKILYRIYSEISVQSVMMNGKGKKVYGEKMV